VGLVLLCKGFELKKMISVGRYLCHAKDQFWAWEKACIFPFLNLNERWYIMPLGSSYPQDWIDAGNCSAKKEMAAASLQFFLFIYSCGRLFNNMPLLYIMKAGNAL
jgi:hypothetical protein